MQDSLTLLDPLRIEELTTEIGGDDLADVLLMFLDEADGEIARITMGLDDADHAKATHFVRSGALNLGLKALADEAAQAAAVPSDARMASGRALAGVVARSRTAIAQRWG